MLEHQVKDLQVVLLQLLVLQLVDVAVVVSAMGDHTDRLVDLAREVSAQPDPRELDSLLSTGEQVSVSLLAMALRDVGVPARSLLGFQVPMRTTAVHGKARIEGSVGHYDEVNGAGTGPGN